MDELALQLGIDPFELRRINAVREGDPLLTTHEETEPDLGLGQLRPRPVPRPRRRRRCARGNGVAAPAGEHWRVGEGMAVAMIATMAPCGHISETTVTVTPDGRYLARASARPSSATAPPPCTPRSSRPTWRPTPTASSCAAPTPTPSRYDTGAFASAGITVAGKALHAASLALRDRVLAIAARHRRRGRRCSSATACGSASRLIGFAEIVVAAARRVARAPRASPPTAASTASTARSRSTCTPSGSRSTSTPATVRILQSVQSADAGFVMNPEQCRGQIEGGVAQAIGSALYEEVMIGRRHGR